MRMKERTRYRHKRTGITDSQKSERGNDKDFGEHLEVTPDGRQRGTYDVGGAVQCLIYPTRDGTPGPC
jgi:hypothetical protein